VNGRSGTSKSYVIRAISARIKTLARNASLYTGPIVTRAVPTSVAVNGINGSTVYSLLKLPITKTGELAPLIRGTLSVL
ncbi:hypothetical protein QBC39DRAFT_269213, partial [Podospora conica]